MLKKIDSLKNYRVLQFETLRDAMYMTVSGAPVKKARHAEPISAMALDMLQAVTLLKNPANKKPMTVTIGKMRRFHRRFLDFLRFKQHMQKKLNLSWNFILFVLPVACQECILAPWQRA